MNTPHAIAEIQLCVPLLTWQGFGRRWHEGQTQADFLSDRAAMLDPDCIEQFGRASAFLDHARRRKTVNRNHTSYGWKHVAERWHRARDPGADYYVSNCMFIAAAIALGFTVCRIPRSPNAWINISQRSANAAEGHDT